MADKNINKSPSKKLKMIHHDIVDDKLLETLSNVLSDQWNTETNSVNDLQSNPQPSTFHYVPEEHLVPTIQTDDAVPSSSGRNDNNAIENVDVLHAVATKSSDLHFHCIVCH